MAASVRREASRWRRRVGDVHDGARPENPSITGTPEVGIVDGFFMMFKPLDPGQHTIRVHGTNTFGHDKTFFYHLTIG
jgi:hypothetical protein